MGNRPTVAPLYCMKELKETNMSMECDTRLSMMALRDRADHGPAPRRTRRARRARKLVAPAATAVATFALSLFTRGV